MINNVKILFQAKICFLVVSYSILRDLKDYYI